MRILWIPHTGWHIPQRAHMFCRALSERHEVHVTDWVADFTTIRDYISRRYIHNFTYRQYHDRAITVHGIPRISPALFSPALRNLNSTIFSHFVQQIIRRHRIDVVVGTFVVPPPKAPKLIFDVFDDNVSYWRSFGRKPEYANEILRVENAYLQSADAVVTVSSVLTDKVRAAGFKGTHYLIPNGVDLEYFNSSTGLGKSGHFAKQQALVGSVGSHDKSAELDKILDAAKLLIKDDIRILVAGRGSAVPASRMRAERDGLSNVIFKGYVPPSEIINVTNMLDVGLCPYMKTPGAEASSPVRLLMYAAAGLPIVCTDLEEVRRMCFSNVVLVKDDAKALAEGIKQALQMPRGRPKNIYDYDINSLVRKYENVLAE